MILIFSGFTESIFTQEKYAILISGDRPDDDPPISNDLEWASWNDTYLMWEMLVYEKGYDNDNVFVLFADGQDWSITNKNIAGRYDAQEMFPLDFPRAFDQITDYPATLENLERLIIILRNGNSGVPEITENDFLLIWAFRPVYDNGKKEIIYFNNNITREVSELNALLKKIPAKKQFTFLSPKRVI